MKIKNTRKQGEIEKPNHWKIKENKMKKRLLILFALITCISVAQNKSQDDIYFKKSIDTKKSNIDSLTTIAQALNKNNENIIDSKKKQSKYIGIIEVGYQKGKQISPTYYRHARIKLNAIGGYQLNSYYSLGIGSGLRYYLPEFWPVVPIFANFKGTIPSKNLSPYLSLGIGSLFDTNGFEYLGSFFDPRLGVSVKTNGKWNLNIAVNYEMQLIKDYVNIEKVFGPICILVGISF